MSYDKNRYTKRRRTPFGTNQVWDSFHGAWVPLSSAIEQSGVTPNSDQCADVTGGWGGSSSSDSGSSGGFDGGF